MIIRLGFVSNSSSSSFIIHKINSHEYVKYMLSLQDGHGSDEAKVLIEKIEIASGQPMYGQSHYEFFWEIVVENSDLKKDYDFQRQMEDYIRIKFPLSFSPFDIIMLMEEKEEELKEKEEKENES